MDGVVNADSHAGNVSPSNSHLRADDSPSMLPGGPLSKPELHTQEATVGATGTTQSRDPT